MDYTNDLFAFLENATTAFTAVTEVEKRVKEAGFTEVKMSDSWMLEFGGKYYVKPYASVIYPFVVGKDKMLPRGLKVVAAHTDSPCFHIKANPEIKKGAYVTLNVERYGGPIYHTWFDRPLSIAGRVSVATDDIFVPKIIEFDLKKPVLTIPSLAIHFNREVNEGVAIKVQKEMQPLLTNYMEEKVNEAKEDGAGFLIEYICETLDIEAKDIIDADMYCYLYEPGMLVGARDEFISAPRLDDLSMVHGALTALLDSTPEDTINMGMFVDNEEIGSRTKNGADSNLFNMILEKIRQGILFTQEQFDRFLWESFMISADGAHALHPNYPEKNDITSKPEVNRGIVIKSSGNKLYATELESGTIIKSMCKAIGINEQTFVIHSDFRGGQTIGPIISAFLPVKTADVGLAMLGMHSTRELVGKQDYEDMVELFKYFYQH